MKSASKSIQKPQIFIKKSSFFSFTFFIPDFYIVLKCKYNGGSVAFGYMIDDEQHFQINPTLAPVVLNIFNDYISGKTQKEIRDELNNKGLKNANGREFTINNISKILTNRRYVGNYIYKDVVIENGIPAIVPNDVFDKVQEMIAVNKRAPSRHKAVVDN